MSDDQHSFDHQSELNEQLFFTSTTKTRVFQPGDDAIDLTTIRVHTLQHELATCHAATPQECEEGSW